MAGLPSQFSPLRDILDGKHDNNTFVNVIGFVADFMPPVATRGKDWKCQLKLTDPSTEYDSAQLHVNIFRDQASMPQAKCGDVMLIFAGKVQQFQLGLHSLITHVTTSFYIYDSKTIPRPPKTAAVAMVPSNKPQRRKPTAEEDGYISKFFHSSSKDNLPTEAEFQERSTRALAVKDKYVPLSKAADGKFIDTIARIVRKPYDLSGMYSLWISDYSENLDFYQHTMKGLTALNKGDSYGYTTRFSAPSTATDEESWTGPFGKRSLQLTCYEPHASAIRTLELDEGSWVYLKNLQIKVGRNGANLEGYLRGDQQYPSKINIIPYDLSSMERDEADPRLLDALHRMQQYEKMKKEQLAEISGAAEAGKKRKAAAAQEEGTKGKRKSNVKAKRDAARKGKAAAYEAANSNTPGTTNTTQSLTQDKANSDTPETRPSTQVAYDSISEPEDVNSHIKADNAAAHNSIIADMFVPEYHPVIDGDTTVSIPLPFTNRNYRSYMRVVDFYPHSLAKFARPKKASAQRPESHLLDEDSAPSSDSDSDAPSSFSAAKNWEWCFYLKLEDAKVPDGQDKRTIWATVDNPSGQCLLNLDASDLRANETKLQSMREKLFTLWGDLEELVTEQEEAEERALAAAARNNAPPDSSPVKPAPSQALLAVKNKPFPCCICQYGVRVTEDDETKADAGENKRWQRMFALFGTRICD